jgi:hypothetical protein
VSSDVAWLLIPIFREESKRSEHHDKRFKQQLDDMITILGRLDDRADELDQETTRKALKTNSRSDVASQPANSLHEIVGDALHDREPREDAHHYKQLVDSLWINRFTSRPQSALEWDLATGAVSTTMQGSFRNAILHSLAFVTIERREEAIPEAFEETFS